MRKKIYIYVVSAALIVSASISGCAHKNSQMPASVQTSSINKIPDRHDTVKNPGTVPVNLDTNSNGYQGNVNNQNNNASVQPMGQLNSSAGEQRTSLPVQDKPLYAKEVFLTFDDGPSTNTQKILDILNEKDVKASFFILGSSAEKYPNLVKTEYNAGMAVLNHSYSHNYSMYKSVDTCTADFQRNEAVLKNILGVQPLGFIRFPGGSDNRVSNSNTMKEIRNSFVNKGIAYVDWNVSSADAAAATVPMDAIKNNVIGQLSHRSFGVVLMHDASLKTTTVEALPQIIDYLKSQGFVFRTFNDLTPTEMSTMIKDRIVNRGYHK